MSAASPISLLLLQTTCLLTTPCPPGEYALDPPNCTSCWPCEPGFQCAGNGSKTACGRGTWSGRGERACRACDEVCGAGFLRVRACDATGDLVCAACPSGFGCDGGDGGATVCRAGTYSVLGVCAECPANHSSDAGASECVCLGEECTGCPPGSIAVGTQCRPSPKGYGLVSGELQLCPRNTYSSASGHCLACGLNAWSEPGASSAAECVCADGFTRSGDECVPCKAGTVYSNHNKCVLCPAGEYCLGKTHHEPCPSDMYSHRGAGMCTPCRLNSGCMERCVSEANCTCDDGYVDSLGECRRCPSGRIKDSQRNECVPCPPGHECRGGADVWACSLTTWSLGNASACTPCEKCPEITAARCNSTHNSVCERTPVPLGVLNVFQQYTVAANVVDGEMFGTFALLYVASIPRAQLLRVCDKDRCVQCFQGLCPERARMRRLYGPGFELAFEVRSFSSKIDESLEALNRPAFLSELAKTTMRKLTPEEFFFFSRIEHSTICPSGLVWDKTACREPRKKETQQRSWVGLGVSVLLLLSLAIVGWNGREWMGRCCGSSSNSRSEEEEEEDHLMVGGKGFGSSSGDAESLDQEKKTDNFPTHFVSYRSS